MIRKRKGKQRSPRQRTGRDRDAIKVGVVRHADGIVDDALAAALGRAIGDEDLAQRGG